MAGDGVIDWLLAGDAAIRWQTLRDLAGAQRAWKREQLRVGRAGCGARLLALQDADGWQGRCGLARTREVSIYCPIGQLWLEIEKKNEGIQ
jgi:hypothetical protein